MAGRPKILITDHLDVSRTSILLNAGQVVHPSQAKPHFVPAEPYKAATSKVRPDDVRPVTSRPAGENAFSSTGGSGCSSGVTPPQPSSCEFPASPSQQDSLDARAKPVNVVDPFISNSDLTRGQLDRLSSSTRDVESQLHHMPGGSSSPALHSPAALGGAGGAAAAAGEHEHAELCDDFASRYERQLQINAELKRLLLASLGSDLQSRLEQLSADKAALSSTVGEFSRRLVEDHEDLDRLSIQADMWRSKFLATKLMADALAQEKTALAQQCTVMASALQDLLDERRLIHSALRATSRYLHKMAERNADTRQVPQSSRRSIAVCGGRGAAEGDSSASRLSCTSRSLAEEILDSVETLAESNNATSVDEKEVVFPSLTSAELKAYKVLHGPRVVPPGSVDSRSSQLSPLTPVVSQAVSMPSVLPRFHKFARYDGAMYFGCRKCSGELMVL